MLELLVKVIPLNIASTLSPGILALSLFLLGSKNHPKLRTIAFLFGSLLVSVGIVLGGFYLGKMVQTGLKENSGYGIVDVILGLLMLAFGFKVLLTKERENKVEDEGKKLWLWVILGFVISITNLDAVLLSLTAAKEVGVSTIMAFDKLILLTINVIFFILPILLPLVFYMIASEFASRILGRMNIVVRKYSRFIIFVLFLIFGIYLLYKGIKVLT